MIQTEYSARASNGVDVYVASVELGVSEFWDICDHGESKLPPGDRISRYEGKEAERFSGSKNYEQASSFARYGWKEGGDRVRQGMMSFGYISVADERDAVLSSPVWDKEGMYFDPGIAATGSPDHWLHEMDFVQQEKHVTLYFSSAGGFSTPAWVLNNRAIATMIMVDWLQKNGVNTRVCVFTHMEPVTPKEWKRRSTKGAKKVTSIVSCLTIVEVKSHEEPVNVDRLAYCCGSSSFRRRHYFSFLESYWLSFGNNKRGKNSLVHDLGESISPNGGFGFILKKDFTRGVVPFDGIYWDNEKHETVEQCVDFLRSELVRMGITKELP